MGAHLNDEQAALAADNIKIAIWISRSMGGYDEDEWFGKGLEALSQLATEWDASKGIPFPVFAKKFIRYRVIQLVRNEIGRKGQRRPPVPLLPGLFSEEGPNGEIAIVIPSTINVEMDAIAELSPDLWTIVDRLPTNLARVVRLYYREGLTQVEIGKQFGVTDTAVCHMLRKAREQLRRDMDLDGWWGNT